MPNDALADEERIDVKQAIRLAKVQITDLMEGESYSQLGLEEVKYDDRTHQWIVTLGFNRQWNVEKQLNAGSIYSITPSNVSSTRQIRTYKEVHLDGRTGALVAIEGRTD